MSDVRLTALNPDDSSPVPVACDAAGKLLLEDVPAFDGNLDGNLNVTGDASITGNIAADSYIKTNSYVGSDRATAASACFTGELNGAQTYRVEADGTVKLGNTTSDPNITLDASGTADFSGRIKGKLIDVEQPESGYTFIGRKADGEATFYVDDLGATNIKGSVEIGNYSSDGIKMFSSNGDYGIYIIADGGSNPGLSIYNSAQSKYVIQIKRDGSAEFAGGNAGFTAEGHLWCTTQRGDTVILDLTSNGLASWADYTPPSRRDLIKEKAEAWAEKDTNDPDFGVSPEDNPET